MILVWETINGCWFSFNCSTSYPILLHSCVWYSPVKPLDGNVHHNKSIELDYCQRPKQSHNIVPAEGDPSLSPTHRHLSGCSVLKYKTNVL